MTTQAQIILELARMNETQFQQFYQLLKLLQAFKRHSDLSEFVTQLQTLQLDFVDEIVKPASVPPTGQNEASLMSKLKTVKIKGPSDFAENVDRTN